MEFIQLKGNEIIKAKKDLRGYSACYDAPDKIDIKEGAILSVIPRPKDNGDCFTKLVSGEAIIYLRGDNLKPVAVNDINHRIPGKIIIEEGHSSGPYSLGSIDPDCWEILNHSK